MLLMLSLHHLSVFADPSTDRISLEKAKNYFAEAKEMCDTERSRLWTLSLWGPIMFVDPIDRRIVANQSDAHGVLRSEQGVFTGRLPASVNFANTAMEWEGVNWTTVIWSAVPTQDNARRLLLAHELFHHIQKKLGLLSNEPNNEHLDSLDGRYLLQLEWKALAAAMRATNEQDCLSAINDAFVFRSQRYKLFPAAEKQEGILEKNEGLAEYTGVIVANPSNNDQKLAALHDLEIRPKDKTFVRSFAYATGPAYGLLLDKFDSSWREEIRQPSATLFSLLKKALGYSVLTELEAETEKRSTQYDGQALLAQETLRDRRRKKLLAEYHKRFVDGPVLTIHLGAKSLSFDPRNLQPLPLYGTVYPTLRVCSAWGVLEVTNGALMSPDRDTLFLVAPTKTTATSGDGWRLDLKPGWKIVPGKRSGDVLLIQSN